MARTSGGTYIVVVLNATNAQVTFQIPALVRLNLRLHPVQQRSADTIVGQSWLNSHSGTVIVPALTTAGFVTSKP